MMTVLTAPRVTDALTVTVTEHPDSGVYVSATLDGREIAWMELGILTSGGREIVGVAVDKEYRRQGIATAMYDTVQRHGLAPVHSAYRTAAGDAWASSVSDPSELPRNMYFDTDDMSPVFVPLNVPA